MPDEAKETKKFQAVQPAIPGVPTRDSAKSASAAKRQPSYLWAVGGGAILVLVIALVWWAHGVTRAAHSAPVATAPATVAQPAAQPVETLPVAPGVIATTSQMKDPWSARKFVYRYSNGDTFPALLVHLHGDTYWAFSLREPYGTCQLEFASVEKLQTYYGLNAKYPMVGDPCTRTVFDLTQYSSGPNGLVRGAVVSGTAPRPPLAIEVEVKGDEIIASRSE
jgi:hypothetical protein